jgi:inositol-pentakisphosphate 2-kinase
MSPDSIPDLPAGVQLQYFAEGGANIVYRIVLPSVDLSTSELEYYGNGTPPPTEIEDPCPNVLLQGKLLRLRKDVQFGIPYQETASSFETTIRPIFEPEELVDQLLVRLPPGLTHRCNEQLRISERKGKRPAKRHGVFLATTEPFGLLITDMSNASEPGAIVAELKPKWLLQSPSAPSGAKRCRTCALREMKNDDARKAGVSEVQSFCPMDLVSDKIDEVLPAIRFLKGRSDHTRIGRALYRHPTLLKLLFLQQTENNVGLKGPSRYSNKMSLAMTLRDCTVFIKVKSFPLSEISNLSDITRVMTLTDLLDTS